MRRILFLTLFLLGLAWPTWGYLSPLITSITTGLFGDGSAGSPSISFTNEPTTGFYRPSTGNVGLSIGGTQEYNFSANRLSLGGLDIGNAGVGVALYQPGNGLSAAFQAGQNDARNITFGWVSATTAGQAYGFEETYAGSNPIYMQRFGGGVGISVSGGTTIQSNVGLMLGALLQIPVQAASSTPTCSASGVLAMTSAFILCVCNGTSWVKTADGSTACTF